jgi:hypothetical protein
VTPRFDLRASTLAFDQSLATALALIQTVTFEPAALSGWKA